MKLKEIKDRRIQIDGMTTDVEKARHRSAFYEAILRDIAKHGCPMDMNKAKAALGIEKK